MTTLAAHIAGWRRGRACLVGIGNAGRGDDAAGVRVAQGVAARLHGAPEAPRIVDAGVAPERVVGRIAAERFDDVVLVDAVEFGGEPGAVLLADAAQVAARFPQVSTHRLSLGLLARWLEGAGGGRAWLLGVQPATMADGEPLTPAVRQTVDDLVELLSAPWRGEGSA